jgi:hypothetical protein
VLRHRGGAPFVQRLSLIEQRTPGALWSEEVGSEHTDSQSRVGVSVWETSWHLLTPHSHKSPLRLLLFKKLPSFPATGNGVFTPYRRQRQVVPEEGFEPPTKGL